MFLKLRSTASREFWVITALFIIGFCVRTHHLAALSLGDDEILTSLRISHSFLDTITLIRHSQFPPLHYMILNVWVRLFGNGEWALRFPSAIFSSLTVIVVYKLGKELFDRNVGIASAVLLAFSPFAVHYAQFAKMYALFWYLEALSFLFFFRFLKAQDKSSYRFYIIASILCCYTLYTGFLFLAIQSIIFWLLGKKTGRQQWMAGQAGILSLCAPWVIWFLFSWHEDWGGMPANPAFDYLNFFFRSFLLMIGSSFVLWDHEGLAQFFLKFRWWLVNCFLYIFLITFFVTDAAVMAYRNKKATAPLLTEYYCLLLWAIIPTFIYFIFDRFFIHVDLAGRYIGFLQIPIILIVGSQTGHARDVLKKVLVTGLIIISVNNTCMYFSESLKFPQQDWRATARELALDLGKNDVVVSLVWIPQFKYYYKGDTSRFFNVAEKDCTAGFLASKGILTKNVQSVFIIYKDSTSISPAFVLDGFSLDSQVWNGGNGFLHFKRIPSMGNPGP